MGATQTVVLTGASRGIGRIAARRVIEDQPQTHLVLLRRGDPRDVVDELRAMGGSVSAVRADLSSLQSVADAADAVIAQVGSGALPPIRALACNAGVQHANALTETVDGHESTFAVNVLANHVLVRRLQDHLHPDARVVVTVSDTHFGDFRHNLGMVPGPTWQPVETLARIGAFPNPESTTAGRTAYSTSKLAAIYLVHEYARRFPVGWTVAGYNPGFVPGTDLARDADAVSRFAMRWIMPLLTLTPLATSPAQAGQLLADAVLGAVAAPNGAYIDRSHVAESSPESYDPQRERETWEAAEALTARFLPPAERRHPDERGRAGTTDGGPGSSCSRSGQVLSVERGDLLEGDQADPVVQVDVPGTGDYDELAGPGGLGVDVVAEVAGVSVLPGDQQDRARAMSSRCRSAPKS